MCTALAEVTGFVDAPPEWLEDARDALASPLGSLSGSALGTQKDYKDTKGYELVKGVELALAELRKVQNPRKVLIVITDGNDTNNDAAKGQLVES